MTPLRLIAAATACSLCLCSCTPTSITFTFGADDGHLEATPVIAEPGGGSAQVALIDVRGLIVDAPERGLWASYASPVDDLVARLAKAETDASVKAVILRINSPGGTVSASDTMYREVRRFAEKSKKPVVASLGEVAASGGYYLALSADTIIAQPTSITGSIGVIMPTMNFSEGLGKLGITSRSIKSGPNKDLANPFEPIREGQYAVLQGMVDEFYGRFRGLVVERRTTMKGSVDDLTDGRVVTGSKAVESGLADAEGNLRDAFEEAKRRAGLKAANLVKYHPRGSAKPRTVYATSDVDVPSASQDAGGNTVNFMQLNLSTLPTRSGSAYYVWMP